MSLPAPDTYDALTFDVYGTLIDWEPAILDRLQDWAARNEVEATRNDLLEGFDRARAHYQALTPHVPYPAVLRSAFSYIANTYDIVPDADERAAFGQSVPEWLPYADTNDAMARLKEKYTLGALTNMDEAQFAASHARLNGCLDVIVTAERAQAYKPSLPHFVLGLTDLAARGIPPKRVLHVAQSLRADVRPANLLGLDIVWINRKGRGLGHTGFGAELAVPMAEFPTMEAFVDALLGGKS